MENASKALIIAGVIFIGILLLALMVYFFSSAYGLRNSYTESINTIRLNEFNTKFSKYYITKEQYKSTKGKSYLTIYNIVTLANYAADFNKDYKSDDDEYILIKLNNDNLSDNTVSENNKLLKQYNSKENKFVVSSMEYGKTGRIKSMEFKKLDK